MKKLIALIVLMSGLAVTVQAETKALIVNEANPEKSLSIEYGQVATVVFWGGVTSDSSNLKITIGDSEIILGKDANSEGYIRHISAGYESIKTQHQQFFMPVVPGPATITLLKKDASAAMITVKIENDSGVGDNNNVTVIPETADDSTLVLEGSDDIVNWTVETLGDKPKVNRKKFYRLRAVKN
jgi:hypothetical protein